MSELSFNSYYEFVLERIPQITAEENIEFNIHDFASILKQYYRGEELGDLLNSDIDESLFDAPFIVFEIDRIKDDAILFPYRRVDNNGRVFTKNAFEKRTESADYRGGVEGHRVTYHG